MKKRLISLLICLLICFSLFTTVAYASTDVSKIMPSGGFWIITDPPEVPVHRDFPIRPDGNKTIIIIGGPINSTISDYVEEYTPTWEEDEEHDTGPEIETDPEPGPDIENELAKQIFYLINTARIDNGLSSLNYNKDLQEAADIRAKEAAVRFAHTRPDDTDFATAITVDYTLAGENIVKAESTNVAAKILVDAWMNSQGHKDNILLYEYTTTAIGIYVDDTTTYAVQLFLG